MTMHVIDYEIIGDDLQFVEVELDPGEAAVGEAGAMMYMQDGVSMDTVFGDGSAQEGGWMGKLFGAGKRLLTGESMFTTVFVNEGQAKSAWPLPPPRRAKSCRCICANSAARCWRKKTPFCAPPRVCRWASPFSAGWAPGSRITACCGK